MPLQTQYCQLLEVFLTIRDHQASGYRELKGRKGYRIRVGDYRVIYDIFDNILLIDVIDLGHRREIYE